MKVLGIHGSPRRSGNSEALLDEALKGANDSGAQVKKIRVADLQIQGCTECGDCYIAGGCTISDDMDKIYSALEWADRIIFASPIFFMGLPSQAKALVDRCQRYWIAKHILKEEFPRSHGAPPRFGVFIGVGGTRGQSLFDGVIVTMKYFFDAISATPAEDLYVLVREVDEKDEIYKNSEAISSAYHSGKRLAELEDH